MWLRLNGHQWLQTSGPRAVAKLWHPAAWLPGIKEVSLNEACPNRFAAVSREAQAVL